MSTTVLDEADIFPGDRQPTVRIMAMPENTNPSGNIYVVVTSDG